MTTKSQEYTSGSGNWSVPSGVSLVEVTMIGGGGGGQSDNTSSPGKPSGGSGEYCLRVPLIVTPGGTVAYSVGAGGAGGTAGINAGLASAGDTTFGPLTARGAIGSTSNSQRGTGGGYGGGAGGAGAPPNLGTYETMYWTGGNSGSGISTAPANGTTGARSCGNAGGAGGTGAVSQGGGAGGPATPWGAGSVGGTASAPPNATSYGGGGGGARGNQVVAGARGADGYILLQWYEHA